MVNGLIGSLLLAWILSWFNFENHFINAFKELFNIDISISSYYIVFGAVGLLIGLIFKIWNVDLS